MSTAVQRIRWRRRAVGVSQLGLAECEVVPGELVEELAEAVLALLDELDGLSPAG